MMTKEQCEYVFNFLKINQMFSEQNKQMLAELTSMLEELDMNVKGVLGIEFDSIAGKVNINYSTFTTNKGKQVLDIYTHDGFDIYYNPASWEIAKREIKDIFFDVRKTMREKAMAAEAKLTTWQKFKRWAGI